MKTKKLVLTAIAGLWVQLSGAATVDLTGVSYVTYGDANSYSLAVANYYTCGAEKGPSCPYTVAGSPGQIDSFVKIVEGAAGHLSNASATMDDAFRAVNNELGFTMTSDNEPVPSFTGDGTGTWDATLSALNTKLDLLANDMTFFFVNNEPNSDDGLTQSLGVWARITLTNLNGTSVYGTWDLTNDTRLAADRDPGTDPGYGPPPNGGGVPSPYGDVTAYTSEGNSPDITDFVMSGGQVCIDKSSKAIVDCTTADSGTFDTINHNLGENQAPYAVVVPEMDAFIRSLLDANKDLANYVMHVDVRYGCVAPFEIIGRGGQAECSPGGTTVSQDNNFEQIFIGTRLATTKIPEPGSLLLLSIGLLGLGFSRKSITRR